MTLYSNRVILYPYSEVEACLTQKHVLFLQEDSVAFTLKFKLVVWQAAKITSQ